MSNTFGLVDRNELIAEKANLSAYLEIECHFDRFVSHSFFINQRRSVCARISCTFKATVTVRSWGWPVNIRRIICGRRLKRDGEPRSGGIRDLHEKQCSSWINLQARGSYHISSRVGSQRIGGRNRVTELIQKHMIAENDRLHERIMWYAFSRSNAFFSYHLVYFFIARQAALYLADWK